MKSQLLSTKIKLRLTAASLVFPLAATLLPFSAGSSAKVEPKPVLTEPADHFVFTVSPYDFAHGLSDSKAAASILKDQSGLHPTHFREGWVKLPLSQDPLVLKQIERRLSEKNPLIDHRQALSDAQTLLGISGLRPVKNIQTPLSDITQSLINRAADEYGLPRSLFTALIEQESQFKPNAVSSAQAVGLGQVLPSTALWLTGKGSGPHDPEAIGQMALKLKNPAFNLTLSARYFSYLLNAHHHDIDLALAAYNAGPGVVAKFKGMPPYPETHRYVERVKLKTIRHFKTALSQSAGIHIRSTPLSFDRPESIAMN